MAIKDFLMEFVVQELKRKSKKDHLLYDYFEETNNKYSITDFSISDAILHIIPYIRINETEKNELLDYWAEREKYETCTLILKMYQQQNN